MMPVPVGSDELRLLTQVGLARGMNVVDFGCGSGAFSRLVARAVGPAGRVLGLDASAFNVARSRELAGQEKLDNTTFEVASPAETRVASDFADLTVADHLLGRVPEPALIVKEMARVTRPGGVVAVFDDDECLTVFEPQPPVVTELRNVLARVGPSGAYAGIGRHLFRLLSEAGLSGVRVTIKTINSTEPEWSDKVELTGHVGLLARALDQAAEGDRVPAEDAGRYRRALEDLIKNPPGFVSVASFFAFGRRPLRCA